MCLGIPMRILAGGDLGDAFADLDRELRLFPLCGPRRPNDRSVRMTPPLIDRLVTEFGWPRLATTEAVDAFVGAPGVHVLFISGDPARNRDTADVAAILPGLEQAFQGRVECAVVDDAVETAVRERLWRAAARLYDIEACLSDALPPPGTPAVGRVTVAAARETHAGTARLSEGRVTRFERVTPTDHLLAPGGILDRALAALRVDATGLAPLMLDIRDPCTPVRLTEARHA